MMARLLIRAAVGRISAIVLAPLMVAEIFKVIRTLREEGTTILMVEQNVKHTLRIADRAYLLENGKIVLEGPCQGFLQDPYVRQVYLGL